MKVRTVARFCVYHYQERLCKYVLGVLRKMRKRGVFDNDPPKQNESEV
jgi:hypothetical protein